MRKLLLERIVDPGLEDHLNDELLVEWVDELVVLDDEGDFLPAQVTELAPLDRQPRVGLDVINELVLLHAGHVLELQFLEKATLHCQEEHLVEEHIALAIADQLHLCDLLGDSESVAAPAEAHRHR